MLQRFTRQTLTIVLLVTLVASLANAEKKAAQRFARFEVGEKVHYGIVNGNQVTAIKGDLFSKWSRTDQSFKLSDVKLLPPTRPTQIFALAGNYKSHINDGNTTTTITTVTKVVTNSKTNLTSAESTTKSETTPEGEVPAKFKIPQPFFKSPSCLVADGGKIVLPKDAEVVHYEAELVIVIGKKASKVSRADAMDYVFGVTCGNDVSARVWQKNDVQWWRAKGSDTFGPCGPFIATGLDYDNLDMELRLNGKIMQKDNTKNMITDVRAAVAGISKHITLHPGDLIFTGTTGKTSEIKAGDTVEVELEGVGVLTNKVVDEK
ncbi:MAG: fumarylacetoacetate hydrolase [Planctomycetaceae bacterium]|nr:fumarylacetoacetate hydrolase [Planctomycetaceae bacterium]